MTPISLLPPEKLEYLLHQFSLTENLPGAVIEIGMYQGGTLLQMHLKCPSWKRLIGYDTFIGLPTPGKKDETKEPHKAGDFGDVDYWETKSFFERLDVEVVRTKFPVAVPDQLVSFAHLDVDLYHSTKMALIYLSYNMASGGIVVVDDYGWSRTPGVKKAVDDILKSRPEFIYMENNNLFQISLVKK